MMLKLKNKSGIGTGVLGFLGNPFTRLEIVVFFLALSAYLGYQNGYAPLQQEIELPFTVQERNAHLDVKNLDLISAGSKARVQYVSHGFDSYRTLFSNGTGE